MEKFAFRVEAVDGASRARAGVLTTPHGEVATPLFMPVGTRGTVRGLEAEALRPLGARMLLANTYHLHLRPGEEVVRELGGLHGFMGWDGPILTDSGGYQVFSLGHLTKVDADGATLKSVVDGSPVRFTPERVIEIETALGADVIMAFDQCPADPTDRREVEIATERTGRWLTRCVRAWEEGGGTDAGQALFGIVQGGIFEDLRHRSAEEVIAHDLPGYAIGGVSTGEDREAMLHAVEFTAPLLPEDRPRYLMGVGTPLDFLDAIERGVDMFDCVTPTRHGRNHQAFTSRGRLNLRNRMWRRDDSPVDPDCDCPCCTRYGKGYLRHMANCGEMLAGILLSLHNLRYFHRLLARIREAIQTGGLAEIRTQVQDQGMRASSSS